MKRIKLSEDNLEQAAKEAARFLERGEAIVFPTDTLYGLGVDATKANAIEKFFLIKKRPASKPVPVFVRDMDMAGELAFIDKKQEEILKKLWPGPFTVVLDKKEIVSARLSAGTDKIGLRMPDDKFCAALLEEFGSPITGSSANISGMSPSPDPNAILAQFREHSTEPACMIDSGSLEGRDPSTVVDITGKEPRVLRMSQTSPKKLKEIFDELG